VERWEAELLQEYLTKHFNPKKINSLLELPLSGPDGLRRQLGELDGEYFARAYFPDYMRRELPAFHSEDYDKQQHLFEHPEGRRFAEAAPRGHAKSVRWTTIFTVRNIVYQKKHYPFIISDTGSQASDFLMGIGVTLEGNPRIIQDFGKLQGSPWNSNELVTTTGVKVECAGSGMKILGRSWGPWRPDMIILDDLENEENVSTPEQRKKLRDWFTKVVMYMGDSYTDFIYVGTIKHKESLLCWVLDNPTWETKVYRAVIDFAEREDLWAEWENIVTDLSIEKNERLDKAMEFYHANESEMLKGTKVLWPDKWSYVLLMVERVTGGAAAFNSEMQNRPIDPADQLFEIKYYEHAPAREDLKWVVGFCDPSMGRTKKSDMCAIVIVGVDQAGWKYVLEADLRRLHPDLIIDAVIEKQLRYNCNEFGIETVAFQEFLASELRKRSIERGVYIPITEVKPKGQKESRIVGLQPEMNNGYIKLHRSQLQLIMQLEEFRPLAIGKNKDDGPDALASANKLIQGMNPWLEYARKKLREMEEGGGQAEYMDENRQYRQICR
jgi:predicted phage terminase large subunit-like protein